MVLIFFLSAKFQLIWTILIYQLVHTFISTFVYKLHNLKRVYIYLFIYLFCSDVIGVVTGCGPMVQYDKGSGKKGQRMTLDLEDAEYVINYIACIIIVILIDLF